MNLTTMLIISVFISMPRVELSHDFGRLNVELRSINSMEIIINKPNKPHT